MRRVWSIATLVVACTACGEFSGTPRQEHARVVDLTQAILDVSPGVHEFGLALTPVGDLDGNGVIDVALSGDLERREAGSFEELDLPRWLLLLSDDPDAPLLSVRATDVGAEARAAHPALGEAGYVGRFRSFEPAERPRLGQLVGNDRRGGLLFVSFDRHGALVDAVAQAVRCRNPELQPTGSFLGRASAVPDRNADGIPELLAVVTFASEIGERVVRLSLVIPSSGADAAEVVPLELPGGFAGHEIDDIQPAAYDTSSGRLQVLAVIVPKSPADPNYGPTGTRSMVSFELSSDGTVSDPVMIADDVGELMGGGDNVMPWCSFVESSLGSLAGGGRRHVEVTWAPLGPEQFPSGLYGGLFPDPLPRESGHSLLGFDWDEQAETARAPATVPAIDWRSDRGLFAVVAIEARDASGVMRRTGRLLATTLPGFPRGEPGLLAALSFEPAPR